MEPLICNERIKLSNISWYVVVRLKFFVIQIRVQRMSPDPGVLGDAENKHERINRTARPILWTPITHGRR